MELRVKQAICSINTLSVGYNYLSMQQIAGFAVMVYILQA